MRIEPGQQLGSYELLSQIGQGGMGVVWKALDTRLGRRVALKILPEEWAGNPERLRLFESEAKTVAALNHPNIVTLHSVEQVEGVRFLTMELIEGRTLSEIVPPGGLPLDRFLDIAEPLADALSAAHERGVVHRDLKPANVMLTEAGLLKILDFGIAKLRPAQAGNLPETLPTISASLFEEGSNLKGTVPYMAPEQLDGKEADPRSDLFSLGVILHEMATGERPFRGASQAQVISAILRDVPLAVPELRESFPKQTGRIIGQCLEKDPELRVQSAKDVRNELIALRKELTVTSVPQPPHRGRAWRLPPIGWAAAALLAGALVLWGLWQLRPGPDAPAIPAGAVAVLPFANLTGEAGREHLSRGIGAGLITRLSEVAGIRIVGRGMIGDAGTSAQDARERAAEYGVSAVVTGELQGTPAEYSVQVEVSDPLTGLVLWSDSFRGPESAWLRLQQEIARRLAHILSVPLSDHERKRMARDPTTSFRAYELFLRGHERLQSAASREEADAAATLFRQALQLDPAFALSHVGLSEALWRGYRADHDNAKLEQARREANRALELDPELPAARVALARVLRSTGQTETAIEELRRVLALHPKPAEAQRELAWSYWRAGALEETEACFRAAAALDPGDWFNWNALGKFLYDAARYPEAQEAFREAGERAPPEVGAPFENLGGVAVMLGRTEEALEAFARVPRPIRSSVLASNIATAYYFSDRADRESEAEHYYELAVRLAPDSPTLRRNLADLYVDLGRGDEARHHYLEALRLTEDALVADPAQPRRRLWRALYAAKAGRCGDAIRWARNVVPDLAGSAEELHDLAQAYALCGEVAAALDAISRAIGKGYPRHVIAKEAEFAGLRGNPRFDGLVGEAD